MTVEEIMDMTVICVLRRNVHILKLVHVGENGWP